MRDRRWVENVATEPEVAGILDRLGQGLDEGGIGIGILNAYAPSAGVQELTAVCQLAYQHGVPTFTHVAYMSRIDPESAAEAYIRLIGYAGATGCHMHICHFNSSSKQDIARCAALVAKARAQGLPITLESYPYGTGSTVIAAAFFNDPHFEARGGTGYDAVQRVTDGHRFRDREELLAAQKEDPSALVLWHVLDLERNERHRELLDMAVLFPGSAIASDAMPWSMPDGSPLHRRRLAPARRRHLSPPLRRLLHPLPAPLGARAPNNLAPRRHCQVHPDPRRHPRPQHPPPWSSKAACSPAPTPTLPSSISKPLPTAPSFRP